MFLNRKAVIAPIAYMALIFVLSSIPETGKASLARQIIQNLLHIPLFGLLAFLWMRSFSYNKIEGKKAIIYSLIIVILYAIFDEYHQSFVPGRVASLSDVLLDTIGCIGGIFISWKKRD